MATRDTPWPPGTPCWADVSVDDVPKAMAFYQALFGWDIQSGGAEAGGYAIAHLGGRIAAGIGPKTGDPSQPSRWLTYLATDDADAIAAAITAAGGRLPQEPLDVMEQGRMAVAVDTAGAAFGLWQAGRTTGIGVANEPGALAWNEQLSGDFDASKAFYQEVFGYEYQPLGDGYALLMTVGREVGGIGRRADDSPAAWQAYFAVADTDASAAMVRELGGAVVRPARDGDYGRVASVADDQGAVFFLITAPPEGPSESPPGG